MTVLLDANLLIALVVGDHVHHGWAEAWFGGLEEDFSTCPITEGSLVRLLLREGKSAETAVAALSQLGAHRRHRFWPDDVPYRELPTIGVLGHRQVTDAYLAELARRHGGRLATLDEGLAALHGDVAELVPRA